MNPSRRELLKWVTLLATGSSVYAANLDSLNPNASDGRLIIVLLRGAYDGLSAFYPYSDPNYKAFRPTISIGTSQDIDQSVQYKLDEDFALHPALSSLIPFWEQKRFAFIPTAGLSKAYRSHFEAQHYLETGQDGNNSMTNGWMNNLARVNKGSGLIGVGEANPEILRGLIPPKLVPRGNAALQTGVLGNLHNRAVLEYLYSKDPVLNDLFINGENSRLNTAMMLNQAQMKTSQESMQANKDASSPSALLQDSRHLVALMQQNENLKLGFLSAGGWDTHAGQGNEKGVLANNLLNLGTSLDYLQNNFNKPNDVIVVLSEFGRTVHENASRGTDHGFGNAMMIMGAQINGGRRLGRWDGLSFDRLNESRDLPVFHDYRSILSQVFRRVFNLEDQQISEVFPGFSNQVADKTELGIFRS
jgi:uncharacterized protein (DUF1501 family)